MKSATALGEVILVFAATHFIYRAVKRFTAIGAWEEAAGTNVIPGAVMAAMTVFMLLIGRHRFASFGLNLRRWPRDLSLGLTCGVVVLALGAVALAITGFRYDPSRPPDPHGAPDLMRIVGAPILGLLALATMAVLFRGTRGVERIPPAVSLAVLAGLLAAPMFLAAHLHRPPVWPAVLWLFFGAGFGEEVFFRGYIQSRVDADFGRPWCVLACDVGPGILMSSLLFGLIHALNTVDYFSGQWDFGWWYGTQNLFVGLLYGYLRTRSGSVWAGAVTHGLVDVFGIIPTLLNDD